MPAATSVHFRLDPCDVGVVAPAPKYSVSYQERGLDVVQSSRLIGCFASPPARGCSSRYQKCDELSAAPYQRKCTPYERSLEVRVSHLRNARQPSPQEDRGYGNASHPHRSRLGLYDDAEPGMTMRSSYLRIAITLAVAALVRLICYAWVSAHLGGRATGEFF